ncbi:MAG TPA: ParA family protein [Gammaproteobacteria bacterium]
MTTSGVVTRGDEVRVMPTASAVVRVLPEQKVRRILVVNGKGGCGKSTVATNLAGYYASVGQNTALFDFDPQGSSMQWLAMRDKQNNPITGVDAYRRPGTGMTRTFQMRIPPGAQRIILDAPAGASGQMLVDMVREADTIIIPVTPSPIDIHATSRFIGELLLVGKVRARGVRMGVVANRIGKKSEVYQKLEKFLATLNIPFLARLHDNLDYLRAAERGMGICELRSKDNRYELSQWKNLIRWVEEGR